MAEKNGELLGLALAALFFLWGALANNLFIVVVSFVALVYIALDYSALYFLKEKVKLNGWL